MHTSSRGLVQAHASLSLSLALLRPQVEMLMVALRQRTPAAAIILLSPMLQSCTRGLKIPRWKPCASGVHTCPDSALRAAAPGGGSQGSAPWEPCRRF